MATAPPPPIPPAGPDKAAKPAARPGPAPLVELHDSITAENSRERLLHKQGPAVAVSGGIHLGILLVAVLFFNTTTKSDVPLAENTVIDTKIEEKEEKKENFTETEIGNDPEKKINYNNDRIEEISVPGIVRPDEPIGIEGAAKGPQQNIPPPAGFGGGQGGGVDSAVPGAAGMVGDPGGYNNGRTMAGMMFGGRSGATREKMLQEGGGNNASEASVAECLQWLQRQQKADGSWQFDGSTKDETGATGLALLPFLAAGQTHMPPKDAKEKDSRYKNTVANGLKYLMGKVQANGKFRTADSGSGYIYGHCLSTLALCEAYGMTNDPNLKKPAQDALTYLIKAQNGAGGWRYTPGQAGDTSVTAWCLQALKSGYLSGLSVPRETMQKVGNFLDDVQTKDGANYAYEKGRGATPTMSAAGLLCRQYLGWGPKNPKLIAGVDYLKNIPPAKGKNEIYYYYYASQVVHFYGGDAWDKVWNPKMRDLLIDTQDRSTTGNRGSWAVPKEREQGHSEKAGGRLYQTCLSVLTLEVYYRHLPLYKRDGSGLAELER